MTDVCGAARPPSRTVEVFPLDDPDQLSFGGCHDRPPQVTIVQTLGKRSRCLARANGRWSGLHDLLGGEVRITVQRAPAQPSEKHASGRRHQAESVAGGNDFLPHLSDAVAELAGKDIIAGKLSRGRDLLVLPFDRKVLRDPVDLAWEVVVDLGEAERFEPARGSWAEVSEPIPAVDDDGPLAI